MYRLLAMAVVVLAGCVSPEQAARNRAAEEQYHQQQQAAYRARLFAECDAAGFTRGTDGHANCVMSLHQQNRGAMMQLLQQEIQRQSPPLPRCTNDPLGAWRRGQGQCY